MRHDRRGERCFQAGTRPARVAVIDRGRIVALGSPRELKDAVPDGRIMVVEERNFTRYVVVGLRERYSEVVEIEDGLEIHEQAPQLSTTDEHDERHYEEHHEEQDRPQDAPHDRTDFVHTGGALMTTPSEPYALRLAIDYPEKLSRLTTAFRLILIIPIVIILGVLSATSDSTVTVLRETGEVVSRATQSGGGIAGALFFATLLMILFRQRYPRWWFDFAREFTRFENRVGAYAALLTDQYPSTEDEQAVHLEIDYPDAKEGLNRWLPLVKWFLAIPHYIVLFVLVVGAVFAIIISWFAILFTGRYPRALFDYVVGVIRWGLRVQAYAFLLVTDRYPPFSLS